MDAEPAPIDPVSSTVQLTKEQVAFYHREGFLAIGAITTANEVEWLRVIYDRLFASRAGREAGDQFDLAGVDEEDKPAALPQILNPAKWAPELSGGVFRVNALAIARQLLGPSAEPMGEHAIFKPARVGAATPWHQDEAYWGEEWEYNSLSIWIPLQPVTVENGCPQFVPKSHTWEVLPHHPIHNDPRVHGLEVDSADVSNAVTCELPAGGATVHHNRTLHHTAANTTDIPRRAYTLVFGTPAKKREIPRHLPWQHLRKTPREERRARHNSK